MQSALVTADALELRPALFTMTFQHSQGDNLPVILKQMGSAWNHLRGGRKWQKFFKETGGEGTIKGQEVTLGKNGWHPHLHVVYFMSKKSAWTDEQVLSWIQDRWMTELRRVGLEAIREIAATASFDNKNAGDYASKWGIDDEIGGGQGKQGRASGQTPSELLWDYWEHDNNRAGQNWLVYAKAFKGKRQLRWSAGLRELLLPNQPEVTDGILVERDEEHAVLLARISREDWRIILERHARGPLLEVANTGKIDLINEYLHSIGGKGIISV